jgi:hypothetical protein
MVHHNFHIGNILLSFDETFVSVPNIFNFYLYISNIGLKTIF